LLRALRALAMTWLRRFAPSPAFTYWQASNDKSG